MVPLFTHNRKKKAINVLGQDSSNSVGIGSEGFILTVGKELWSQVTLRELDAARFDFRGSRNCVKGLGRSGVGSYLSGTVKKGIKK